MKNVLTSFHDGIQPDHILKLDDINETLALTIKKDRNSKLVTFLAMISAYTKASSFNVAFVAPSSTGKSYIPNQIAELFPKDDVQKSAYSSPTSFFHKQGEFVEDQNLHRIDLSHKILVFGDMPHPMLLERLRPMLSHDDLISKVQITDKDSKGANRTKNIELIGFPTVIFCSANTHLDEQESTRFILLSPEFDQEKIKQGIITKTQREADPDKYSMLLENNEDRKALIKRINKIKNADINEVLIKPEDAEYIDAEYMKKRSQLKPRHQRDIGRLISIIKAIALVNFMFKEWKGSSIFADRNDIEEGLKLWNDIAMPQELNLPPFIFDFYWEIIVPCFQKRNEFQSEQVGVSRGDITRYHYKQRRISLDPVKFRQQILPALRDAGLIYEVEDKEDKRNKLIFATLLDKANIYGFTPSEAPNLQLSDEDEAKECDSDQGALEFNH